MMVRKGTRQRMIVDGGGLCSPGLWAPWKRDPVGAGGREVGRVLENALASAGLSAKTVATSMARGGLETDPFEAVWATSALDDLIELVRVDYDSLEPLGPPVRQNINFRLLSALLKGVGDPDWEIFREYEKGVRLGVGVNLPRSPLIFPEKVKWNVPGQAEASPGDVVLGAWREHYGSAK